jgi:hypothetical protein
LMAGAKWHLSLFERSNPMATKTERLLQLWRQYHEEFGQLPVAARDVIKWAVEAKRIPLPEIDPYDALADDLARALREEFDTDTLGRRFRKNHAVRVTKGGVQHTFWAIMGFAPHEHMQMAFAQRREQIIGDCAQLKTDVDVYNDMNKDKPPVQLVLDFTDDVAEREAWRGDDREAA